MSTVLYVIAGLVILTVFVFVHELGHYGVGRLFNFEIDEFALGMGPAIIKHKSKKTGIIYALRCLPIGGMCRFYGEDEEVHTDRVGFNSQKVGKRALVVAAGPVMNFIFAFIVAVVLLVSYGDYVTAVDSLVEQDSPAAQAGMLPGDILVSVDGKKLISYTQVGTFLQAAEGDSVDIVVEREGELITLNCRDIYNEEEGRNFIGIYMASVRRDYSFFEAVGHAAEYIWALILEMISFIGSLFKPGAVSADDVGGPVTIVSFLATAVRTGFETVLRLSVLISVNLGFINLLPLPALDGGRMVFMGIEAVRGKPVPAKVEGIVHFVGLMLLLGLIIFLTVNDVGKLIGG